jgi:hypothetical protein
MGDLRNKIAKEIVSARVAAMQARLMGPSKPPFVPKCELCGLEGLYNPKPDGGYVEFFHITGDHYDPAIFRCVHCLDGGRSRPETNVEEFTPGNAARRLIATHGSKAWLVAAMRAGAATEANQQEIARVWLGAMAILEANHV